MAVQVRVSEEPTTTVSVGSAEVVTVGDGTGGQGGSGNVTRVRQEGNALSKEQEVACRFQEVHYWCVGAGST